MENETTEMTPWGGAPMEFTAQVNELFAALAEAKGKFPTIEKGRTAEVTMKSGGKYTYSYADLSDVVAAITKVMSEHGLVAIQPIVYDADKHFVVTTLAHKSGQMMSSRYELWFGDNMNEQEKGSVITYSRRYALCAMLGIAAEEDDDGQVASDGRGKADPKAADAAKAAKAKKKVTEGQIKRLFAISVANKWTKEQVNSMVKEVFSLEHADELNMAQYDWAVAKIEKMTFAQFAAEWARYKAEQEKKAAPKDEQPAQREPGEDDQEGFEAFNG